MSLSNKSFIRSAALWVALFLASSSFALDERFDLFAEKHYSREQGIVTQNFLITETTKYFFHPPYKWRLGADAEHQAVTFLSPDQSVAVKMQIESDVSWRNLDELRLLVKSRHENSEIVGESVVYTSDGIAAPSFDTQWRNPLKIPITARTVFVPTSKGTVEFSLATGTGQFETNSWAINAIASSFRTEAWRPREFAAAEGSQNAEQ